VDILNATRKIAVEVQGSQHSEYNKFFHGDSRLNYLKSIKRDVAKEKWLVANDFTLVEIYENEVKNLNKQFFKDKYDITL
jgi:very-short-patch-repair endonuclease